MMGPTGMTISLDQLPIRKCLKCGGTTYTQTFQLRYCSAIQSPMGKAGLIFIQTGFSCIACMTPVTNMQEEPPKEEKPVDLAAGDPATSEPGKVFQLSDFAKKKE